MTTSDTTSAEKNNILRKINLQFRTEKLPSEFKQEYIRQALDYYHQTGNITKFEFIATPNNNNQKNAPQTYTIQKGENPGQNSSNKKELTSFAVKFDKDGNAIAKDNQGKTLPPASPEEVFKTIVQKFKANGSKKLYIKAPNDKKDERISGIFAKECIMSGIAPYGDVPQSSSFWQSLKKEFLNSNHTIEEWRKLTAHIPQANSNDNDKSKSPKKSPQRKKSKPTKQESKLPLDASKEAPLPPDMAEQNLGIKQSPKKGVLTPEMLKRKSLSR